MTQLPHVKSTDKALFLLTATIVGFAVIAVLYAAQKLLIPVALAIFFAFLLGPVVIRVQRWGLNRVMAVMIVTLSTTAVILGFGWLVTSQVVSLAGEMPNYQANIKNKIEAVPMLQDLVAETGVPTEPLWLRWLPTMFGPVSEVLGQIGLIIVLTVFILLAREDLRNRLIRLVGHGRLTVTTKAVDDATHRLSRFLLMQLIINVTFGICVTAGLTAIGVQYALLWGVLGAVLRYVPYLGSPIAALFPLALSIAQFDGWLQPGLVALLIVGLELLCANVFEPLLFGHSIGVSAVALLIAAAFWAFLWGPIGLVLSGPLTVCLVVLGKYVPHLAFLTVLLSDEPPLSEDFTFYQRLTARDEDEATDIVLDYVKEHPSDEVYDALLIPALIYAGRDLQRHGVDEDDLGFIHETTREILADVGGVRQELKGKEEVAGSVVNTPESREIVRILGVPARGQSDEIALEMFQQMLMGHPCELVIAGHEALSSELRTMIEEQAPAAVCIAALPPGGLTRSRLLCKSLRASFPDLRLLVGRWGVTQWEEQHEKVLREAGADYVWTTLIASRADVIAWLPALAEKTTEAKAALETSPTITNIVKRHRADESAKAWQLS